MGQIIGEGASLVSVAPGVGPSERRSEQAGVVARTERRHEVGAAAAAARGAMTHAATAVSTRGTADTSRVESSARSAGTLTVAGEGSSRRRWGLAAALAFTAALAGACTTGEAEPCVDGVACLCPNGAEVGRTSCTGGLSVCACSDAGSPPDGGACEEGAACPCPPGFGGGRLSCDTATPTCLCAPLPDGGVSCDPEVRPSCGAIDFLFVIDNSLSMAARQQALIASVPSFIRTIRAETVDEDVHVMVVDTDGPEYAYSRVGCERGCPRATECPDYECGSLAMNDTACDLQLGAGVVFPVGRANSFAGGPSYWASNRPCDVPDGQRYLDVSLDDEQFADAFSCIARVGVSGNGDEQPLAALTAALETHAGPGGCNEGFLRPHALLVVVVISDASAVDGSVEAATYIGGDIGRFRDAVVRAKCGHEEGIVVLGLVGDLGTEGSVCDRLPMDPDASFYDTLTPSSPHLRAFVESFGDNGFLGSVCADAYGDFFRDATAVVRRACDLI